MVAVCIQFFLSGSTLLYLLYYLSYSPIRDTPLLHPKPCYLKEAIARFQPLKNGHLAVQVFSTKCSVSVVGEDGFAPPTRSFSRIAFVAVMTQFIGGVLGNRIPHSRIASATRHPWNMAPRKYGGPYRDRTGDLLLARQALSQLS